jgi:hypothetical protein
MTRTVTVSSSDRFKLLYQMVAVGAQIAAQKGTRSVSDVRAEVRVLDALESVSATGPDNPGDVLPCRTIVAPVELSISQPDHELLVRYLDLAAPAWHIAKARECVAVLDMVSAAERVE